MERGVVGFYISVFVQSIAILYWVRLADCRDLPTSLLPGDASELVDARVSPIEVHILSRDGT